MAQKCSLLDKCGFFKKYQTAKDLACKGFVQKYCTGPKMNECKRMEYRLKHGTPPCDEMMPTGRMVAEKPEPK
jgi:hypothetical protein